MPSARSKNKSRKNAESHPSRARKVIRWAVIAAFMLISSMVCAKWSAHRIAVQQFRVRNYEAAETWFTRSRWIPGWSASDDLFWQARLSRKLLQTPRAEAELVRAESAGCPTEFVRKERLLIQAHSGRLTEILPALQAWLANPDDDSAELCESFTNGLLVNGLADDAAAVIQAWKQEYPLDPQPFLVWGRWLESQQATDAAELEYQKAIKLQSKFAPAYYALGRLLLNRGAEVQLAAAQFKLAASLLHSNEAPRIGEARCLDQLGQGPRAREILEQVIAAGDIAIQRSFALVKDPDTSLPGERLLAEILTGQGEYERAMPLLARLLEREPRDPTVRYLRAQCLQGTGMNEEAKELFQKIADDRTAIAEADRLVDEIRQHPADPQVETRYRVGELFWKHDSTRKAEYWLRNTLALNPHHVGANRLLAECYELRAQFDPAMRDAAEHYRKLGEKTSGNPR